MRQVFLWSALGLVALGLALLAGDPVRLVALPVALASLLALPWPRRLWVEAPTWVRERIGPCTLTMLCGMLYAPLLAGRLPVNHDHPVFLLHAWVTGIKLIPSGGLTGFSDTLFAGYPANSLYPMGTSLLVVAIKGLTLGLASWETAYAWALFLAILAYPLALYALGRRALGPVAGVVAGLLGLIDRGSWSQSGWEFNINWGVWSMASSFALCLWSVWGLDRLALRPGRFTLVGTACAVAGALLFHPMAVAVLGTSIPVLLIVMIVAGRLPALKQWLPRVVVALALGAALAAWWLLPFMAHTDYFEPLASPWRPFDVVVRGLLHGNLLREMSPLLMLGGLVGMILAARRRNEHGLFWLVLTCLLLFVSTNTFLLTFGLLPRFPSLAHLQMERFTYPIRTAALLGFGFLVELIVRGDGTDPAPMAEPPYRQHVRRMLLAAIAAPLLVFGARAGPLPYFVPAKPLVYADESPLYRDMRAASDFLNHQDPSSLGRIAVVAPMAEHSLMALPVYTGLPIFKIGFTPEDNYRYKFDSNDPEVWRAVNISHALSIGPLTRTDVEEVERFGQLVLYRFPLFARAHYALTGPGQVQVLRDEPEATDIRIEGAGPGTTLKVFKARYALWQAKLGGTEVPIDGVAVGDSPPVFMELPVHDGLLKLRYRSGRVEWFGAILSWLGLAVAGVLLLLPRSPALRKHLAAPLAPLATPIRNGVTIVVLACLVLGLLGISLRLILPPPQPFPGRVVVTDLSRHLSKGRAEIVQSSRSLPCEPYSSGKIRCPGSEQNYAGEVILLAGKLMRQCIWLHPIKDAKVTLHLDNVPLGETLQGNFGLDDTTVTQLDPQDVDMIISLDGTQLGRFPCHPQQGWYSWEVPTPGRTGTTGRVTIESHTHAIAPRNFCFTAYTTRPTH